MGWTYTHRQVRGEPLRKFFEKEFTPIEFLRFKQHGYTEAYAVCQGKTGVFGLVILIRFVRGSTYYNFGYKEMDESMGPCYYNAPLEYIDLLDKLAPLDDTNDPNGWARKWRQDCRATAADKKLPPVLPGDILRFESSNAPHFRVAGRVTECVVLEKRRTNVVVRAGYHRCLLPARWVRKATVVPKEG